jgi:ribose transport system ATP-binding protein
LVTKTKVLLLDEPTASISGTEADKLFGVIRRLRDSGTAILFVSHKLEEVFDLCDTVTVLRDGVSVLESKPLADFSRSQIVDLMVGRQMAELKTRLRVVDRTTVPALELVNFDTILGHRNVNLDLHRGEILGMYGLVGAGRSELARTILGLHAVEGGEIWVNGHKVRIRDVRDALNTHRIGYVTENRKEEGIFLDFTVGWNIAVTVWRRIANRLGMVLRAKEDAVADGFIESLGIKVSGKGQLAGNLSGGNQQKVSLAKWLAAETEILIIDEPTVGVDVRTKAAFHELILDLADGGLAILLISSDLPEMINIADQILVMNDYAVLGEFENTKDYRTMSREVMATIHNVSATS